MYICMILLKINSIEGCVIKVYSFEDQGKEVLGLLQKSYRTRVLVSVLEMPRELVASSAEHFS